MPLFRRKSERQISNPQNDPSGSNLPRSASSDSGVLTSSWNGQSTSPRPQSLLLSASNILPNSDDMLEGLESPVRTTSCLSKTLQEVLRDKDALSCFISFMKAQRADQLIRFWCDVQSFQANTLMRMQTHALHNVSKSTILRRRSESLVKDEAATSNVEKEYGGTMSKKGGREGPSNLAFKAQDSSACESSNSGIDRAMEKVKTCTCLSHKSAATKEDAILNELSSMSCDNNPVQSTLPSQTSSSCPVHASICQDIAAAAHVPSSQHETEKTLLSNKFAFPDNCSKKRHSPLLESASQSNVDTNLIPTIIPEYGLSDTGSFKRESDTFQNSSCSHHEQDQQTLVVHQVTSDICDEDVAARLRKSVEHDAVNIFSSYIAKDSPRPIGVDDQMRAETISRICMEDGNVDPECFRQCQDFVFKKFETEYFQSFKDSEYHCRHQINVLTSGHVHLPDILLADNALCYFMEYMEQEGASDLLQLWLAVENFQQQLTFTSHGYDWEQAQNDAMVIYDKYFSLQATHPMGFDDKLRFEIESNICREGGPLPDCFTKAKIIVLHTLDKIHFSHYLKSQVFHRYLSDLVSTVQVAEDLQNKPISKAHRRNASDASSEHSIGSQSTGADIIKPRNTLLAVDTRKVKKGTSIEGDFSMSMEMFNPDDLWKRTSPGSMSLGSVDELGQFVSAFDSDAIADKKKGSGFLRRWRDKEKEQEEMALQIAQMIIKDVNKMTTQKEILKDRSGVEKFNKSKTGGGS